MSRLCRVQGLGLGFVGLGAIRGRNTQVLNTEAPGTQAPTSFLEGQGN